MSGSAVYTGGGWVANLEPTFPDGVTNRFSTTVSNTSRGGNLHMSEARVGEPRGREFAHGGMVFEGGEQAYVLRPSWQDELLFFVPVARGRASLIRRSLHWTGFSFSSPLHSIFFLPRPS